MFKIIAAVLMSVYFLFQMFLYFLYYKNRHAPIPEELNDVYDEATYLKWQKYSLDKIKLSVVSTTVSFAMMMALLMSNVFSVLVQGIANEYTATIVILSFYIGVSTVVDFIFSYIRNMKIEEKYGFNKSTLKTFIIDQIKGVIIQYVLIIGLSMLFIVLYNAMHDYILILFTGILFLIIVFISFLYPALSKIYNKFTSLEEGELRTSLINMLESHNYQVRDIKVMNASKRTTKSNAYFAGFGKSKTIVLFDNMVNAMTTRQIVAVFAHEMGHGLHKDTIKNQFTSLFTIAIFVVLAWLLVRFPIIHYDFGFIYPNVGFALILLMHVLLPFVTTLLGFLTSYLSRRAEYRADEQAVIEGYGEDIISALKILAKENLSDLNPHPLIVLLSYTHPTLLQRVRHIKEYSKAQ